MLLGDTKDLGYIRRCRDLVQLWYGARMVVTTIETRFNVTTTAIQILPVNPARIRYELYFSPSANQTYRFGIQRVVQAGAGSAVNVLASTTQMVIREWTTELDMTTQEVWAAIGAAGTASLSCHETILTPPPVDEIEPQ